jgi:phosphopantothenoylcysteine decarboxylase/phosphopantothenate--cysteine ligase
VLVGFAAQTGKDGLVKAQEKYAAKNLDVIYFNDVSQGAIFGSEATSGSILVNGAISLQIENLSKVTLAHELLNLAVNKLGFSHD